MLHPAEAWRGPHVALPARAGKPRGSCKIITFEIGAGAGVAQLSYTRNLLKGHSLDFMRVPNDERKVEIEAVDTIRAYSKFEPKRQLDRVQSSAPGCAGMT